MRLIDADALIDDIKHGLWDWDSVDGIMSSAVLKQTITDIKNMPTIEAEPIKHGKWIKDGNTSRCSECGYAPISKIFFRGEKIWEISLIDEYHYCPYCGAKMEQEMG